MGATAVFGKGSEKYAFLSLTNIKSKQFISIRHDKHEIRAKSLTAPQEEIGASLIGSHPQTGDKKQGFSAKHEGVFPHNLRKPQNERNTHYH